MLSCPMHSRFQFIPSPEGPARSQNPSRLCALCDLRGEIFSPLLPSPCSSLVYCARRRAIPFPSRLRGRPVAAQRKIRSISFFSTTLRHKYPRYEGTPSINSSPRRQPFLRLPIPLTPLLSFPCALFAHLDTQCFPASLVESTASALFCQNRG